MFEEGQAAFQKNSLLMRFVWKMFPSVIRKRRKYTVRHMNLTVNSGEKFAIVGLNGAGKTTLVKLICGFLDPTEGRVLLNGQDIRQYDRRDYYELFAAVFQDFSILDCTVAENVSQKPRNLIGKK